MSFASPKRKWGVQLTYLSFHKLEFSILGAGRTEFMKQHGAMSVIYVVVKREATVQAETKNPFGD